MATLSLTQPEAMRHALAQALTDCTTLSLADAHAKRFAWAYKLGRDSDSLGCAFVMAYQLALREVDAQLKVDEWAAFCISERGVRSPYDLRSRYQEGVVVGEKSHVMQAALTWLYLLVKDERDQIVCVKVPASAVEVLSAEKPQPFLPDVLHQPVQFNTPATFFCDDAHRRLNKPFRYWEDMLVVSAFCGWLSAQTASDGASLIEWQRLQQAWADSPAAYSLASLDAMEALIAQLTQQATKLAPALYDLWQRDTLMLRLTQTIRQKIRQKLA